MDTLISAVAGDLVSRFISFLSEKYGKQSATTEAEDLERLRCVLLRISTVVEEAEARRITNRGMILQLKGLMEGMYLGHHVLDRFKFQSIEEEEGGVLEDPEVSSDHKRLRSSTSARKSALLLAFGSGSESTTMLKNVLASLEVKISDAREFVMLLASCPGRLPQQPYSTYLFMDKCMFGRHSEKEQVISFLLHDDQNLGVLPIIGPHRIGKKTLVHHACQDERVRGRFPHIVFLHGDDLMRNRSLAPSRKYLCIVEFGWDADVEAWEAFQSSLHKAAGHGSKVIILGRTDDEIGRWGTTPPIRLKSLPQEQYWYYFKALSFGSMDPDEHPKLASLGMQLATELKGSFLGANILGQILRGNPNAEIWRGFLTSLREMSQKRLSFFGDGERCPDAILEKNNRADTTKASFMRSRGCLVYDLREAGHVQSELPRLTSEGPRMEGRFPCDERFDVLVWRSRIPPFCDYTATFEKQKPRRAVRRKNHLAVGNCRDDLV